jgi:hypothetical protein
MAERAAACEVGGMRLRSVILLALLALVLPAPAHAAGLFVLSQGSADAADPGVTGLIQLSDGGGESVASGAGGAVITGTGGGPLVYNSGGLGSIQQFSGGAYHPIATGVGGGIRSMTVTGRGLVVANGSQLQYVSGGHLGAVVPHTQIADGPWISITTEPSGLVLGWAFHGGVGRLYEFNLASGAVQTRDFDVATSPLLDNCVPLEGTCSKPPVPFSGGISADGQGGLWVAGAGTATGTVPDSRSSQLYYAANSGGTFNSIDVQYTRPHVSATGTGGAYVSSTDNSAAPYLGAVYRFTAPSTNAGNIATGKLADSYISDLAVDRCYTFCSLSPPSTGGGVGAGTQKVSSPSKSVKLGKKGLLLKLKCSVACTVTVTGKLAYGASKKAKKSKASPNAIKKTTAKLKANKAKTITLKLSKKQRKKVKSALRHKRKVVAKLKIVVKAPGVKTVTRRPKLRVK